MESGGTLKGISAISETCSGFWWTSRFMNRTSVLPPGALVPLHQALADLKGEIMAAVETLKNGGYAG